MVATFSLISDVCAKVRLLPVFRGLVVVSCALLPAAFTDSVLRTETPSVDMRRNKSIIFGLVFFTDQAINK